MYLERLLQINMATLAVLGAMLLGMGQRSEGPPLLVALAAVVSMWLTDVTRRFCLGRHTANILMLLAAAVSLGDVFTPRNEMQTFSLAWFLIYLQIILFFQKKNQQIYWFLVMLSLLQVVVATLFSQGVFFGLLLATYMLLGFSAMTLLMMYRQWERHQPVAAIGTQSAEFVCLPGGESQSALGSPLLRRLGRMGLQTLGLTFILFFAVPRYGQLAWRGAIAQPQPLVGFTDKVMLGELGQVAEDRGEVLRIRFRRTPDETPRPLQGDVYLQGAVLMRYSRGQWETGQPSVELGNKLLVRERPQPRCPIMRQEISIEGLDRKELFFVAPFFGITNNPDVEFDCGRQRLCRSGYCRWRRFPYVLGTTAIVDGEQSPYVPASESDRTYDTRQLPQGKDALPRLTALAQRWIDESKIPDSDPLGQVRCLERKLAMSGQFRYSLTGQPRDPDLDPIEDFVTKHPAGHCEYFATALTLMLRSQKFSARMISGYKIGRDDWNAMGGYYQVRQLHAHTWVEVRMWKRRLPLDKLHGRTYWNNWKNGGWLRLDPTPAGAVAEERTTWLTPVQRRFDWLESAWSNYVVELDCQRQREAVYKPIADMARFVWNSIINANWWRILFESVTMSLYLNHLSREARWIILGLMAVFAMAIAVGMVWLVWRLVRRLTGRKTGQRRRRRGGVEVEFYRRFERLLARWGLVRQPAQTQREFAAEAGRCLAERTGCLQLAAAPAVVADAFYRVRFGLSPLDNLEAQKVEQALDELVKGCEK